MATADKILLRLTKAEKKISTVVDLTSKFNANGSVYQDISGWDVSVLEIVNPTGEIKFQNTNDDGSTTGQLLPSPEVPINWVDVMGVDNLKNDVTSVNYTSTIKFGIIGKYLNITNIPAPNMSLTVANSSNFDISENADFTIEWFAFMANDSNHPRAYSISSWPAAQHAVSIENSNFYWWVNGSIILTGEIGAHLNQWSHYCVMRSNGTVGVYVDGVLLNSASYTSAIPSNGFPLYIGSEGNDSLANQYTSNFRWNSTAVYNPAGFSVPTAPLSSVTGTKLLLFQGNSLNQELTDNSGLSNSITNGTGIYNENNPFAGMYGNIQFGTV